MTLTLTTVPIGSVPRLELSLDSTDRRRLLDPSLAPAFVAHDQAEENLAGLLDGEALCVTTGQQPGLMLGPSLTIYKAMSAVAAAKVLERRCGRPVVPVFWVAGDDHDFAEANHFHLLALDNRIDRVVLRERDPRAPLVPLYKELLGDDVELALAAITRGTPETDFRPKVMEWLSRHYRPENDLASAFAGALAELMGRYGLIVFRPTAGAAKCAAVPPVRRALEHANEINEGLKRRARELAEQDAPVPVAVDDATTGVMIEAKLGRDRLLREGDRFVARRSGESWSRTGIVDLLEQEPERFSPNVLVRPVVEAALLPTIAYVAGPSEYNYLMQTDPIYDVMEIEPQHRIVRWGGTIIEARISKVLEKYNLVPDDLAGPEGQLESRLVRDNMPPNAKAAISRLRTEISGLYESLEDAASEIDATLRKPIQSARNTALHDLGHVEKRIVGHLKKRNEIVVKQLSKARHSLYPLGRSQERVLNIVPFLIRYGESVLDQILEKCEEWNSTLDTLPTKK
ncbi:MAG: bacillithiol biosynthesis cysteine-adding enzyme BshC [Gemmatimonadales bacterium]